MIVILWLFLLVAGAFLAYQLLDCLWCTWQRRQARKHAMTPEQWVEMHKRFFEP